MQQGEPEKSKKCDEKKKQRKGGFWKKNPPATLRIRSSTRRNWTRLSRVGGKKARGGRRTKPTQTPKIYTRKREKEGKSGLVKEEKTRGHQVGGRRLLYVNWEINQGKSGLFRGKGGGGALKTCKARDRGKGDTTGLKQLQTRKQQQQGKW